MTGDYPFTTTVNLNPSCHGCFGKGWVETSDRQPHKCPVCLGSGKYSVGISNPYPLNPYPQPIAPLTPVYPPYQGPIWVGPSISGTIGDTVYFNGNELTLDNTTSINIQETSNEIE